MASKEAQDDFHGGMHEWKTAEGVATEVKFRDDHDNIIADIVGGLRSGLNYGGASTILTYCSYNVDRGYFGLHRRYGHFIISQHQGDE